MPRGKYVNHKGRCRQFTSSEQLQQELGMMMDKDQAQDLDQGKGEPIRKLEHDDEKKNSVRGGRNLIQISNPNRLSREMPQDKDKASKDKCRQQPRNSQAQADLERLSIVRKEREAAAERRLAAKKAAAEADASRMMSSLKKIPKQCNVGK